MGVGGERGRGGGYNSNFEIWRNCIGTKASLKQNFIFPECAGSKIQF